MIRIFGLSDFPIVRGPFDLEREIVACLRRAPLQPRSGDILVIAHKIISKAEGRTVDLHKVEISSQARELAARTGKDPRLVEVILRESSELIRVGQGHLITEQRLGLICANAGVDGSNSGAPDHVVLLPADPDGTAERIRSRLAQELSCEMAVLIADTQGRPFRVGAIGTCIGIAGMAPLCHLGGRNDLFNYTLKTTVEAVADELCAAATLVMGQCDEGVPLALIQGYAYQTRPASSRELLLKPEQDLFRS